MQKISTIKQKINDLENQILELNNQLKSDYLMIFKSGSSKKYYLDKNNRIYKKIRILEQKQSELEYLINHKEYLPN